MDPSHDYNNTYTGICLDGTGANQLNETEPNNGRILDNLAQGANYIMSHILHFYHLVALDYVDVNGTGLIPKGFLCPNYDSDYYARGIDPILQTGGLGAPAYTVNNAPNPNPGIPAGVLGDLTPYLAGQYVRALKFRRLAHQLGALFTGKMPHASSFTPAGMTTKVYDPTPGGSDAAVVQKVHELLYGGPGFDPTVGGTHPFNGQALSPSMPHPESLLGFIGKPSDFWVWASTGFLPAHLPVWALAGVPGAAGGTVPASAGVWHPGTGQTGSTFTGTFMFDTVAAAHVFPEYFWIGSGHGRYLAWGIFEGAAGTATSPLATPDGRLLTRGRVHVPRVPNGVPTAYAYEHHTADHQVCKEFTPNSFYYENLGTNAGRHMWDGRTVSVPKDHPWLGINKPNAYTYAKSPRHYNNQGSISDHPLDSYLPYEVGPLARLMSNAVLIGGGPATAGQVVLVDQGDVSLYYPGVLADVDAVLGGVLGMGATGVFPNWGANMAAHLTFLQTAIPGSPALYLPPGALPPAVLANQFGHDYYGGATLDRIAARTLEAYYVAKQMLTWFNQLTPPAAGTGAKKPGDPGYNAAYPYDANWPAYTRKFADGSGGYMAAPTKAQGAGLTEAPRGALGHWIRVFKGKVYNYQIITPTTWNINPKDAVSPADKTLGQHGPIEEAIMGTPLVNEAEPLEILRVIHSFDPCCACTVHVMDAKKEKKAKITLEALI